MTPIPLPTDIDLVIHHNDHDGFTAAWAAWKVLGDKAKYISTNYGNEIPDVKGQNVAILDFWYARPIFEKMLEDAKSLVLIDHHKDGLDELKSFPNAIYDLEKAGAQLAWEWFHPDTEVPRLVKYVSDRDIWKFELPHSHAFSAALRAHEKTIKSLEHVHRIVEMHGRFKRFLDEGNTILVYEDIIVSSQASHAILVEFEGIEMWCMNATMLIPEVGQKLREREIDGRRPGVCLMWLYNSRESIIRCSMRSSDERTDVSEICKQFGGGGHRNSAGFEWQHSLEDLLAFMKPVAKTP